MLELPGETGKKKILVSEPHPRLTKSKFLDMGHMIFFERKNFSFFLIFLIFLFYFIFCFVVIYFKVTVLIHFLKMNFDL